VSALEARTFNVDDRGVIRINPTFAGTLSPAEFGGVLVHEIMHLALDHGGRARSIGIVSPDGKVIDPEGCDHWNVAGDWVINERLKADGIALPECAIYPPKDYPQDRARTTEAFYYWRRAQQAQQPQPQQDDQGDGGEGEGGDDDQESAQGAGDQPGEGEETGDQATDQGDCSEPGGDTGDQGDESSEGEGSGAGEAGHDPSNDPHVGAGCGVLPTDHESGEGQREGEGLSDAEIRQMAREIRASARQIGIGVGSSKCLEALEPSEARLPWERLIRSGFDMANAKRGHSHPTYARRSRRSPLGVILPAWVESDARIAFMIDVSGSMDRAWVARIVAEIERCAKLYQARAFLVTHTDRVCWEGWITPHSQALVTEAIAFSGGTRAQPAYEAVDRAGRFDVLIHFTDCEIDKPWPENPAKRLIVAAFGSGATGEPWSTPPEGAELIPVMEGGEP
jgi:predicted metal-dependent peptidase